MHADRVATLTLLSTSPVGPRPADRPDLPPMSPELASRFAEAAPEPDWSDREAVIDHIVEGLRPFSGSLPFDEDRTAGTRRASRRPDDQHRVEHEEPLASRRGRAGAQARQRDNRADPGPPRNGGSRVPLRARRGARPRDPRSPPDPAGGRSATSCPRARSGTRSSRRSSSTRASRQCECGAVRYSVADEFLYASNCHCSRCRAATGSAFKPFAGIEREKLEITDGADGLLIVGEEALNDTRCAECGSLLFSVVRDGAFVARCAGLARRRPEHAADEAHLRRLQGAVVRDHGRPAAVRGARDLVS